MGPIRSEVSTATGRTRNTKARTVERHSMPALSPDDPIVALVENGVRRCYRDGTFDAANGALAEARSARRLTVVRPIMIAAIPFSLPGDKSFGNIDRMKRDRMLATD